MYQTGYRNEYKLKSNKVEHKFETTVCVKGTDVSRGLVLGGNICQTQCALGDLIYSLFGQEAV